MSTVLDHPPGQTPPPPEAHGDLPELPRAAALESKAIIKGRNADGLVVVGMVDPKNGPAFDEVVRATGLPRREFVREQMGEEEFNTEFRATYRSEGDSEALSKWGSFGKDLGAVTDIQWAGEFADDEDEDENAAERRPARVGTLDETLAILAQAQQIGASDMHFMPEFRQGSIRVRIDGLISPSILRFKKKKFTAMVNTIIQRAGLDPEDIDNQLTANSKVKVHIDGRSTEYRASFVKTEFGRAVVLRLNVNVITDIARLGFEPEQLVRIRRGMQRSKGIMLMVGPTGAGKSNTMEAIVTELDDGTLIIYQIGDPNEFIVPGRYQIHVGSDEELDKAYRQALRHDPDIICPGEIRSAVQAIQAIKGAQTGHLVMSTLHAGSASEAISRLIGLQIDPFYLSDFLIMVIGQRLIPKLCTFCRVRIEGGARDGEYRQSEEGCKYCMRRGVYERQAVCEVLLVTPAIKRLIRERAPTDEIERVARAEGMMTMQESAERKIKAGIVSRESVDLELGGIDVSDLVSAITQ